jgi:acyl-CoA synthetase (AMP-forming)/AMP-acid ligase II
MASSELPTPLEALLARAKRSPEATALIAGGERWSCARLVAESARVADGFQSLGIRPGDRIALHMLNIAEAALAFLACWRAGAIVVPLNTRYKTRELEALIIRVRPKLYLGQDELFQAVRNISTEVMPLDARFVAGNAPADARPWAALMKAAAPHALGLLEAAPAQHDALAMLMPTSGTTGPSKLVVWTLNTLASLTASATSRGIGADDTILLSTPMMHASGSGAYARGLLTGAVMALLPRFEADAALDAIAAHRCTTFLGLPSFFASFAQRQRAQPRDVSSLRLCFAGGDVCSTKTEEMFAATFGLPLLSMWGATEDSSAMIPATKPGPLTRVLPGTEIRLVDRDGQPVPDGATGEMLIRSPGTTPGYWLGPGRIEPLPDGWLHTGDLMRRDPDGQFRYMGRIKDLIVRAGSNISPVEVEQVLRRQPGIANAAVVGLQDAELGQRVGAALVLAAGVSSSVVADALEGTRRELADYKVPVTGVVVDAIPSNALGKVDRSEVIKLIISSIPNSSSVVIAH